MNQSEEKKKIQPKLTKEEKKIPIQHLQQKHVASGGIGRYGYMNDGVLGGAAGRGELEGSRVPGKQGTWEAGWGTPPPLPTAALQPSSEAKPSSGGAQLSWHHGSVLAPLGKRT